MLNRVKLSYGCDPEGFFTRGGQVIGSEKVLPPEGLRRVVVRDGVQWELNPQPSVNLSSLGLNISNAFRLMAIRLREVEGVSVSFEGTVEVSRDELDSLTPRSRVLGCQPSKNVYGDKPIMVDPDTYPKRSAGGHMHFGMNHIPELYSKASGIDHRSMLIPVLDYLVSNTLVLLDRDQNAALRRENYGRAGEYRDDKNYGFEYRTPSSFWLKNYTLMDLAYGMAAFGLSMLHTSYTGEDIEQEFIAAVNIDDVIQAIDTNDFDLALKNFKAIEPLIRKYSNPTFPLHAGNIDTFLSFAHAVHSNRLEVFFPEPVLEHWIRGKQVDFNRFLSTGRK